jgi:hypothetical protein
MMSPSPDPSLFFNLLRADGAAPGLEERLRLFGQFVGSWNTICHSYPPDGSQQAQSGEIHFAWVLGGRAIQDLWISPARDEQRRANTPFDEYGSTIRFYDEAIDAWRVTWITPLNRRVATLTARAIGDEIVLAGVDTTSAPFRVFRWIFSDITPTTFHWRNLISQDGGHTWRMQEELDARRMERTPDA